MELTLKRLLEHAEFKKYRGKGYDPTEVDDFLDRAAVMAGKVEVQLTHALEQAKAAGSSGPDPEAVEAEIERRVAERVAAQAAEAPRGLSDEEVAAEAQRTLVMAQRTADAAVREAREDADKLLAAAKEQADALLGDAEARSTALNAETEERAANSRAQLEAEAATERREARQRLANEIGELEGIREALRSDVNVLERHVEEQRSQLGSTLAELHQILDDPSGFRLAPAPALADPELPDFSDLAEPEPSASVPAPQAEPQPEPESDQEPEPSASEPEPPTPEADAEPEPAPRDEVEGEGSDEPGAPAAPTLAFEEVDHEAPGVDDPPDGGPPTAPVSAVDLGFPPESRPKRPQDTDEDTFLAELRKAMSDDQPLGPRDHDDVPSPDPVFEDEDRRGWRFGRRR
jgi:DivIVA domain-containing protein